MLSSHTLPLHALPSAFIFLSRSMILCGALQESVAFFGFQAGRSVPVVPARLA